MGLVRVKTPSKDKPTVAVALDGFLAHDPRPYDRAWRPIGEVNRPAVEMLKRLARVANILIYTSRVQYRLDPDRPEEPQRELARSQVKQWLDDNGVWYDAIWMNPGKPVASLFIGPREVNVPFNPCPDDLCAVETDIKAKLVLS
jgi:hypothetical protein